MKTKIKGLYTPLMKETKQNVLNLQKKIENLNLQFWELKEDNKHLNAMIDHHCDHIRQLKGLIEVYHEMFQQSDND